jgi:hypothetical protein
MRIPQRANACDVRSNPLFILEYAWVVSCDTTKCMLASRKIRPGAQENAEKIFSGLKL